MVIRSFAVPIFLGLLGGILGIFAGSKGFSLLWPYALMQAGMSDIQVEAGSMEFAGADHSTLRVTSTISEIPVYELMVCVKEGNYMGVITLASYLEDTTEEMAALFTAVQ